ncbi:MAG: cytochrome c oxidase subunit 3 [Flavobacteriales bacterium]|nr:cytochrome c oxidase subunit 3 [Flavobacteriales bacterium]
MAHAEEVDNSVAWNGNGSPFKLSYGKQMMWFFLVSDALTFGGLLTAYGFSRHAVDSWPVAEKVFRALPGTDGDFPLIYVALMTFILIISSVTMVLAVEAGHRKSKRGVKNWLIATVIFGFIFVGSQAWEWYHFIHGSHHGAVLTEEGWAFVKDLQYEVNPDGFVKMNGHDPVVKSVELQLIDHNYRLIGGETSLPADNPARALEMYHESTDQMQGADLIQNEYAPDSPAYADFFFFITGFHGFHVFSGVLINLLILIKVIRGAYDKRGHFEMVEKSGLYWHFVDLVWVFVFTFFYLI